MSEILAKETAGLTLTGVIDGVNKTFHTTYPYNDAYVQVYLNGLLLRADLDTGYTLIPPSTIVMNEAPQAGPDDPDTLEVEYKVLGGITGGGALGGVPGPIELSTFAPTTKTKHNRPMVSGDTLEPNIGANRLSPSMATGPDLRPVVISDEEKDDC